MSPGSSKLLNRCGTAAVPPEVEPDPEPEPPDVLCMEVGRNGPAGSSTTITPAPGSDGLDASDASPNGVVGVSGCARKRAGGGVFGRIAIGDRLFALLRIS